MMDGVTETDLDLTEAVLGRTQSLIAGVRPGQETAGTPCPEFTVGRLVDHLVGWAGSFATRLTGGERSGDPNEYRAGPNPAEEFREAAGTIVAAYRAGSEPSQHLPAGFITLEFLTHGWDLATASGQDAGFDPAAAELALRTAEQMLKPEYRGNGKAFGAQVAVPASAGAVDRLVAFMGRDPGWRPML